MKYLHYVLFVSLFSAVAGYAQTAALAGSSGGKASIDGGSKSVKRGPVFRATKDQIVAAQTLLKTKHIYSGEASGKLDPDTRTAIKNYQKGNGLSASGSLNRATLEKMGIDLNEKQRAIPVSESSYAKTKSAGDDNKPRRAVFRATKEQVLAAQKMLKTGGMYSGEETGKLDDPTREGLKKYQEAKGLKATGTLNQMTLEKMGISLTEKQKGSGGTK